MPRKCGDAAPADGEGGQASSAIVPFYGSKRSLRARRYRRETKSRSHSRRACRARGLAAARRRTLALDTIETQSSRRDEVLGGAACYASLAASFFAPVRLVAWWDRFPVEHEALLRSRTIDLAGLERVAGRTFRWAGRYAADFNNRTTLDTQLNVFESVPAQVAGDLRRQPVRVPGQH